MPSRKNLHFSFSFLNFSKNLQALNSSTQNDLFNEVLLLIIFFSFQKKCENWQFVLKCKIQNFMRFLKQLNESSRNVFSGDRTGLRKHEVVKMKPYSPSFSNCFSNDASTIWTFPKWYLIDFFKIRLIRRQAKIMVNAINTIMESATMISIKVVELTGSCFVVVRVEVVLVVSGQSSGSICVSSSFLFWSPIAKLIS